MTDNDDDYHYDPFTGNGYHEGDANDPDNNDGD